MTDFKTEELAQYNEAFNYLGRLNFLQQKANNHNMNGQLREWYRVLKTIYVELYGQMKPAEKEESESLIKGLKGFVYNKNVDKLKFEEDLNVLDCVLRRIIHDHDMGMPKKLDPGMALLK